MSDLQCHATLLLVPREALATEPVARAFASSRLAGCFVDAAVAADPSNLAAIRRLAEASQCPIETFAAELDAESLGQAADDLADLYRGETIALVTSAAAIQSRLKSPVAPSGPITIAIDGDGWVVTRS